jgi:hypothetical protein
VEKSDILAQFRNERILLMPLKQAKESAQFQFTLARRRRRRIAQETCSRGGACSSEATRAAAAQEKGLGTNNVSN